MSTLIDRIRNEPAVVVAAVVAVLALVGVNVSDANADLVTQVLVAVVPIVGGLITRSKVAPIGCEN